MKRKIGFYFDARGLGTWSWEGFLSGNVGMSGTDGQSLLLVNDLAALYTVYFFTNVDDKRYEGFETIKVKNLEDAATCGKQLAIDLMIFNNKGDDETINGINKMEVLELPFILWDHNGPTISFESLLAKSEFLKRIVNVSKTHANWHRHRKYFQKVTYIYNGRDYPLTNQADSENIELVNIGYLGAVGESKGFHWVAQAWPKIKRAFPKATLTVIGSIKTHDHTRKTGDLLIAEPDFEDRFIKPFLGQSLDEIKNNGVIFTGHITPNQMPQYMSNLQLGIVNPNILGGSNETFCVSAIDFQACGVPVVGANAGGLKETVSNGETGILINDSNKLADAVIQLFSNRKQLTYYKGNCVSWVKKNFSRAKVIADWEKVIEDILNHKENKIVRLGLKDLSIKLIIKDAIRIKNKLVK